MGNALVLSTNPQACARGGLRPAQPARRTVRTCRIGEAGTAPTSTAKSRIDAVPHTVLGTHAGAVFQSLPNASMCAVARGDDDCPAVFVRALHGSGAGLQSLRSRPDLLRTRLCTVGAARRPARGWPALPGQPPRSSEHAARAGRYRARQKNVTHQGSPPHRADDLVMASAVVSASKPPSASPGKVARQSPSHRSGSWSCHWCGCRCPPFVRREFLRRRTGSIRRQTWPRRTA